MFCVKLKLMERHLLRLYLLQNNNPSSKEQSQLNQVLWLGNSYTFYNDLPAMVARLAAAEGKSILYSNHTEVILMCQLRKTSLFFRAAGVGRCTQSRS